WTSDDISSLYRQWRNPVGNETSVDFFGAFDLATGSGSVTLGSGAGLAVAGANGWFGVAAGVSTATALTGLMETIWGSPEVECPFFHFKIRTWRRSGRLRPGSAMSL